MLKFCGLCGHETKPLHDAHMKRLYHTCASCGLITLDKDFHATHEEARMVYDLHENDIHDEAYQAYFNRFLQAAVFPYVKGKKALDYGSGPEPVLAHVLTTQHGYDVTCYDLHYAPDADFSHQPYDLILSTEVFEHLLDPIGTMLFLRQMLKPGGHLAIMTLLHDHHHDHFLTWWYRRDITHISFYSEKTLEYLGRLTGFHMIYCDQKRMITFEKTHEDLQALSLCPLCGRPNRCAFSLGQDPKTCWCMTNPVPEDLIKKVPEALRGKTCICQTCVKKDAMTR